MPSAGEFCNRRVVIATRREPILVAARRMHDEHVGSVVVVEEIARGRKPIGIVTDRDIVVRYLAEPADGRGAAEAATVDEIMTRDLVVAREREDLADVCARMRAFGIRRVPVVDDAGVLQGIIAFDDILEWASERTTDLAKLLARERENEQGGR